MSECKISCGNGWGMGANIHIDKLNRIADALEKIAAGMRGRI